MSKEKKKIKMKKKKIMRKVMPHLKRSKLTMRNHQNQTMKRILKKLETFLGTMSQLQE